MTRRSSVKCQCRQYKIKFVPRCLIENSAGDDTIDFLKWGTRQYTWVRWYYPLEWTISCLRVVLVKVLLFIGIALLILGYNLPGLLMVSSFFLEMILGWQAISTVNKLIYYPKKRTEKSILYSILMPFALFVISYNYLASAIKKEVKWCGRYYTKKEALSNKI